MIDHALAGVRAIVLRNDALARDTVGVLHGGLERQQARTGGLGNSNRWHAIVQLFEDEGRKLIRSTADDVSKINTSGEGFAVIETAFREFLDFLETKYFALAFKGQAFGGSRPDPGHLNNPLSAHWWQAKERLELEIEASRAMFPQTTPTAPATVRDASQNKGGKPLAAHWDGMWAEIAVQLWNGDLKPKSQAEIKEAMMAWFNNEEIDIGDTSVTDRARALWIKMQAAQ
jgi:hypothetical protein